VIIYTSATTENPL